MKSNVTRAPSRPKTFWQHHIRQWKKSGQSKAKYCRDQKLNAGTFYNWCSDEANTRIAKSGKADNAGRMKLLPVTLTEAAGTSVNSYAQSVSLEHSLGRFSFPPGLSAEAIEQWLRAIGQSNVQS
jgi:hypothetical protein